MAGICFWARTATMASHSCCARAGSDTLRVSRGHQGSPGASAILSVPAAGPAATVGTAADDGLRDDMVNNAKATPLPGWDNTGSEQSNEVGRGSAPACRRRFFVPPG